MRYRTRNRIRIDHRRPADTQRAQTGDRVRRPITEDRIPRHAQIIVAANNRTVEADLRTAQRRVGAERDFSRISLISTTGDRVGIDRRRAADTQRIQIGHRISCSVSENRVSRHSQIFRTTRDRTIERHRRGGKRHVGLKRDRARICLRSRGRDSRGA